MAGFSRNPAGWQYAFQGMNTVEAPDAVKVVQYPIAINIRALPNHSVMTRPGYDQLFVVESAPVITDTCPIDEGATGTAYSYTFTVVGGTGPYTWAIIAGALPDGLTLNSSTGEVSGTPTEFGSFSFTIQVTDSIEHEDSMSCSVTIAPLEVCGTLQDDLQLGWRHNSRIGPYAGPTSGHIYFTGADPNNDARLITVKSSDYGNGGTWVIADDTFPTLTNAIASFDCHKNNWVDDDLIYVVTQEETTGRVAFHIFDRSTSTWTLTNSQVVSSVSSSNDSLFSGITILPNGDIGVMYTTNTENVSATDWTRTGYRYSTDGGATWSFEIALGINGQARNFGPARPVSDSANRVQAFMGNADLTVFFGEYWVQTILADHSTNTATLWQGGSGLSQIQIGRMGDYCTFEDTGVTQIVFLGRMLTRGVYTIFASSDNMTAPYQPPDVRDGNVGTTFNGLGGVPYGADYPQLSARMDSTGVLHFMGNSFSNSVPTYFYHKIAADPYAPGDLTPSGDADQAGPIFTFSGEGIPGQEMAASVEDIDGTLFYISLRDSGTAGLGLIYNLIRVADLPTSASETIAVWAVECAG